MDTPPLKLVLKRTTVAERMKKVAGELRDIAAAIESGECHEIVGMYTLWDKEKDCLMQHYIAPNEWHTDIAMVAIMQHRFLKNYLGST